jgi:hypothetical protein
MNTARLRKEGSPKVTTRVETSHDALEKRPHSSSFPNSGQSQIL